MTRKFWRGPALVLAALTGLAGCDTGGAYVGGTVYYDSLLWNDYYYGRPPPPTNRPPRPENPIERPPRPTPPIARPPTARPPIHRPAPRPRPARL